MVLQHRGARCALKAVATAIVAATSVAPALAKEVRCTCPSVSAEGYGSSSCSANESGGLCRVEFNEFSEEALAMARKIFGRARVEVVPAPPSPGGVPQSYGQALALARLPETKRVQAVLLYLGVAASRNRSFDERKAADLGRLFDESRVRQEVAAVFGEGALNSGLSQWQQEQREPLRPGAKEIFNSWPGRVYIAPGCVSVKQNNEWYMYKAFWSTVRLQPQCGER